jgi:hypothetical protein
MIVHSHSWLIPFEVLGNGKIFYYEGKYYMKGSYKGFSVAMELDKGEVRDFRPTINVQYVRDAVVDVGDWYYEGETR